jgi:hypothetical protein
LIQNVDQDQAEITMQEVAKKLGLSEALKLQAGFAGLHGHRHNIGQYFMSVNQRGDYQFIPPHSEGNSFAGMQLASFFCYENSTDGGETVLLNVDSSSRLWPSLREKVRRGKLTSKSLTSREILRARGLYQLQFPADLLRVDDEIIEVHQTEIEGLTLVEVLAKPQMTYSRILDRKLYVYWDSISNIDFDSALEYERLLRQSGLLKEPTPGLGLIQMDNAADRHIWHSGITFSELFTCKITRKLSSGELLIQNNLTWAHATTNWSPNSGIRKIAASFA